MNYKCFVTFNWLLNIFRNGVKDFQNDMKMKIQIVVFMSRNLAHV